MDMKTWKIHTEAETRSKSKRSMDHLIQGETEADAIYEARQAHWWKVASMNWDRGIYITSIEEA